ncbi:DUF4192 domain-containing protein [Streptomyces chartreusis]|uniref:DUF4192 domain-containing protein n=1 Tax=Streptomyces chartreusis TaxID=1969 RepID=UPI00386B000B|nr:DUF4192 domain-containing protein [Streptomyces chartreusis]
MLRTSADLVEFLPFLFDVEPVDSLVVVGLPTHRAAGRLGLVARVDLPTSREDFDDAARGIADDYVRAHTQPGTVLPGQMVLYLCATPATGEQPQQTMRRLKPLADAYRAAFTRHGLPVLDSLCIIGDRYWSYARPESIPKEGAEVPGQRTPGSVSVAAVVNGAVRAADPAEVARAFTSVTGRAARRAANALGRAVAALNNRAARTPFPVLAAELHQETRALIEATLTRIAEAGELPGARDTARLIAGIQDRRTRDFALACDDHRAAHRLWQHLARHCVAPHEDFAPPLLTLYGWTSWLQGDIPLAKVAFKAAISTNPEYKMASYLGAALAQGWSVEEAAAIFREAAAEMGY